MNAEIDDDSQLSDKPITVVEIATGKKLVGEEAPLLSQLQDWLSQNPGWEIDSDEEDDSDEDYDIEEDESKWKTNSHLKIML